MKFTILITLSVQFSTVKYAPVLQSIARSLHLVAVKLCAVFFPLPIPGNPVLLSVLEHLLRTMSCVRIWGYSLTRHTQWVHAYDPFTVI